MDRRLRNGDPREVWEDGMREATSFRITERSIDVERVSNRTTRLLCSIGWIEEVVMLFNVQW